jgi:periplasmic divalent cation tolerance protein
MALDDCVALYVTCGSREEALKLGRALVEERLAACANVLAPHTAIYRWQGALQEDAELGLLLKTRRALVVRATARIKALHSYSTPCVVAFPIVGGNPDFLAWIAAETVSG